MSPALVMPDWNEAALERLAKALANRRRIILRETAAERQRARLLRIVAREPLVRDGTSPRLDGSVQHDAPHPRISRKVERAFEKLRRLAAAKGLSLSRADRAKLFGGAS